MFKIICILALTVASVISIPVESSTKGLDRPSPINPEVVSEPKPKDVSTKAPETVSDSHIQKVPAKGAKLSSEVDQHKLNQRRASGKQSRGTTTTSTTTSPQISSSATSETPKTSTTQQASKKVKRQAESETSTARSTTTTRAPIISSADENDNTPPHFVRPVPVEQILKNIHDTPKRREPSQVVSLHDHVTPTTPTTLAPVEEGENEHKNNGDHKLKNTYKAKKNEKKSSEEGNSSDEDKEEKEDKE